MKDWQAWHRQYDDPASPLSLRLQIVQGMIGSVLTEAPPGPIRVLSMCAGDGRDLLGVVSTHPRGPDVYAHLVELDSASVATGRERARSQSNVFFHEGDAGVTEAYSFAVPADLLLVCGVFGNIIDADVEETIRALPSLATPGATVIWTRHRRTPDLTPSIRRWFEESGFEELAFVAPQGTQISVGLHRLHRAPDPFEPGRRLFTFVL